MKKILLMLLLTALLISTAACGAPGSTEQLKTNEDGTASSGEYSKPMTISFASVQITQGVDYNGDEFSKYFLDRYNFKWDIIAMPFDSWAEKMRIWINSNDMPDMAVWNYLHGEAITYADQGLVRRLPDDWKEKWPNIARAYESSQIGPAIDNIFGGTYFLPRPTFSGNKPVERLVPHNNFIMRKDWLEAVGAEIKDAYKMSEIIDIARRIKEQDPDRLGTKLLPMNMTPANAAVFVSSNSSYSVAGNQFYIGEDNKYHWGPAAPETLVGLKLYQQAFREGLLNPEFFTLKTYDDYASFYAAGQTGIYLSEGQATNFNQVEKELKKNLDLNFDDAVHIAHPLGEDGKYHSEEVMNFWGTVIFSPRMEEEKLERILDMMDFVASDEGQLLVRLGFEDKDYSVEPDGSYKILLEEGAKLFNVYKSVAPVYSNMIILSDDFMMVDPSYPEYLRDTALNMYKSKASYADDATVPARDWTAYFQDSQSRRKASFNLGMEYAQLITMDGDIEANWRQWIENNRPLVEPVLEELNALIN